MNRTAALRSHSRGRRWAMSLVGAAAALIALFGCAVVALYNLPGMQEPSFETDKALLRQTKGRLTEVVAEFNALPLPNGITGKDATYSGCGTESGALYQPFAFKELTVPPLTAVPAAASVAQAFRDRGWTASPDGPGAYKLAASRGDWSLTGWVAASPASDVVWVQARIADAGPCRLT